MQAAGSVSPLMEVRDIALMYGQPAVPVLESVSFAMAPGEIMAVLGASGCGKTTLLHVIAGFVQAQMGEVRIGGAPSSAPSSDKAMVFQEDALFPWLRAWENVAFGLKAKGIGKRERKLRAMEMLGMVGLQGSEMLLPHQLSGGMRQRVALARVLVLEPKLLLMDEPFAALDALTREDMHELLLQLHASLRPSILFVTHDVSEAAKLADRVLVLDGQAKGIIAEQCLDLPRPRDLESQEVRETIIALRSLLKSGARIG